MSFNPLSLSFCLLATFLYLSSIHFVPSFQCCCDCCCGGDDSTALLMALLGGTPDLSLGRKKRETSTKEAENGQNEKPKLPPKFRFGKDDPTPLLMGWPVHSATQLKPAKDSISEWYRRAFAEEKDRQRANARAKARKAASKKLHRRQRRLAELMHEAIQRAVRLRRQRKMEEEEEAMKFGMGAAATNKTMMTLTRTKTTGEDGH